MRKSNYFYLFLLMFIGTSVMVSCAKDESLANQSTIVKQNALVEQQTLNVSNQIHTEFLDLICSKIANREISKVKNLENISKFRVIATSFFNSKYGSNQEAFVNIIIDNLLGVDKIQPPSIFAADFNLINSWVNNDIGTSLFQSNTQNLINVASAEKSALGYVNIIGIAQASYNYWKNADETSCYYTEVGSRACLLCKFFNADLNGAGAGAALGSVLGGVVAGPGAVMGGTIGSGLEALSW